MATSGSTNFSITRNQIITEALEDIGAVGVGETLTSEDLTKGARKLNIMVKRDMVWGLHLWALQEGTLFLVDGQESYQLGSGGDEASADYVKTELSADGAISDTTISVASITGIASADVIGIEDEDGDLHWTTVNGAPSGTTITITDALTVATETYAHVYAYTTIIERPVRIIRDTVRVERESGSETPINLISREEYLRIPDKSSSGMCSNVYYDPQLSLGVLYTWPTCNDVKDVIHFTYERTLEDFDAASNNPDFPIEASDYLIKGLRYELSPSYGVPQQRRMELKAEADEARELWLSFNNDNSSICIYPIMR